jgi:hypothetical protein
VFEGGLRVREALVMVLQSRKERDVVAPGQIANGSLAISEIGPCLGEGTHVLEVRRREPLHVW